jgi:hypothetical protein
MPDEGRMGVRTLRSGLPLTPALSRKRERGRVERAMFAETPFSRVREKVARRAG